MTDVGGLYARSQGRSVHRGVHVGCPCACSVRLKRDRTSVSPPSSVLLPQAIQRGHGTATIVRSALSVIWVVCRRSASLQQPLRGNSGTLALRCGSCGRAVRRAAASMARDPSPPAGAVHDGARARGSHVEGVSYLLRAEALRVRYTRASRPGAPARLPKCERGHAWPLSHALPLEAGPCTPRRARACEATVFSLCGTGRCRAECQVVLRVLRICDRQTQIDTTASGGAARAQVRIDVAAKPRASLSVDVLRSSALVASSLPRTMRFRRLQSRASHRRSTARKAGARPRSSPHLLGPQLCLLSVRA